MSSSPEPTNTSAVLKFALGAGILILLVAASQVAMPLQAILLAIAVSDLIFLLLVQFGGILPDKRR